MAEQSAGAGTEVAWPAKPRLLLRPVAEEAPAANSRAPAFGFLPSDEEEANEPDVWNAQTRSINRCFYSSQKQRENCTRCCSVNSKITPAPGKATPPHPLRRSGDRGAGRSLTRGHAARVRWRWGLVPGQMLCLSGAGLPICKIKTNFEDVAENRDLLNK